ncbi:MAG TPA: hypothetical protein VMF50_00365 [Candidatus Binataceae bacterium]|nr:hypothetical protein [Candidatus Binataceae bacterium]
MTLTKTRLLVQARATVRLKTAPGDQLRDYRAQYCTQVNGRKQEVHFTVNTLANRGVFVSWRWPAKMPITPMKADSKF